MLLAAFFAGVFINSDAWNFWCSEPLRDVDRAGVVQAVKNDVDCYAQPGVEAVFYNMNFQRTFYDTKVGTIFTKDVALDADGTLTLRGRRLDAATSAEYKGMYLNFKRVHEVAPDLMKVRYDYCKSKGIEMWHSLRMDDVHWTPLQTDFRPQHGDMWLDRKDLVRAWYRHTWRGDWHDNALDYGQKEVFDYHLAMVRELMMDWESDGIELDWLRSVPVFKPGFDEANAPTLTRFMRAVRGICNEAAKKWGHPMRVAVRVPGRVRDATGVGMDVPTWAKEKLIDVLIPSCNNTNTEQDYDVAIWRVLAPKPVILAPCIDAGANAGGGSLWYTDETDAGFASNFYQQGADAAYFYNHFPNQEKQRPYLRRNFTRAADRRACAAHNRRHPVTRHDPVGEGKYWEPCFPDTIWPNCCNGSVKINCGEAVKGRKAWVVVGTRKPLTADVYVNTVKCRIVSPAETPLPAELPQDKKNPYSYLQAEIPVGALHDGWNAVEFFNRADWTIMATDFVWTEIRIGPPAEKMPQFHVLKGETSHADGLYAAGEDVEITFEGSYNAKPADGAFVRLGIQEPGRVGVRVEQVRLGADGRCKIAIPAPKTPGWITVDAMIETLPDALGNVGSGARAKAGALCGKDAIMPALPPPADFKSFWDAEIAKLDAVPMKVLRKEQQLDDKRSQGGKVREWEVFVDCVGPRPATGFVSMPRDAKPKSLPIVAMFQGAAGIAAWPSTWYGDVAICVSASKFGLPNVMTFKEYQEKGYYKSQVEGFEHRGAESRDESFFKWMILRDLRLLQYAKSLPEWNGKVLVVNGESLGGAQSLAVGALDPDVTFICACVPALSDHNGRLAGRRNGWPQLWRPDADGRPATERDRRISEASRYVDVVNFCSLITPDKEVSIGTGLLDSTCPPEGVWAAYNAIPAGVKKHVWHNPKAGHEAGNGHGGRRIKEIVGK